MSAENISSQKQILIEPVEIDKKSFFGRPIVWFQIIVFLAGLGLLFYVLYNVGFKALSDTLSRVGWGFVLIIALNGIRHLLRTLSMYLVVPPQHRLFKFRQVIAARLGGEAVSFVTFTGPFLGEATKAALLKGEIPLSKTSAAIIVDNLLYYISVIVIILGGVGALAFAFSTDSSMNKALIVVSILSGMAFIGLFLMLWYRFKPVGYVIRRLTKFDVLPAYLDRKKEVIFTLEENIYEFYLHHKATFFAVFGVNFLAHAMSVLEVFAVLSMLGFTSSVTIAFIIESLTKVINLTFSFIPGAIGVYEGGNGVILNTLGYATATGVALALVRRGAILFWTLVGIGILLWRAVRHGKRKLTK